MKKQVKLMAAGDIAQYLGVSYQYIDKLAKEGRIPFQLTSSGRIFFEEDVVRFQKARSKKAKTDRRIKKPLD